MQQTRKRLNVGVGDSREFGRVGIDVVAPTNVRAAQTDTSSIERTLDGFAQLADQKADQRAEQLADLARFEAERDLALDRVDEERMAGETAYAEGIASARAEAEGLRMVAGASADLDAALAEDPNISLEDFLGPRIEQYLGQFEGEGPLGLKTKTAYARQLRQRLTEQYTSRRAKLLDEEAKEGFANVLQAAFEAGGGKVTPEALDTLTKRHGDVLDEDERRDIIGSVLMNQLALGNTDAFDMANMRGYLNDAKWGPEFQKQREATLAKAERERLETMRNDIDRTLRVSSELTAKALSGSLTRAELVRGVNESRYLPEEAERAWNQQMAAARRRQEAAAKEANTAQRRAQLWETYRTGRDAVLNATVFEGAKRDDFQDIADYTFGNAWTLAASPDPAERQQGLQQTSQAIRMAHQAGLIPTQLKEAFNRTDTSAGPRFIEDAEKYRELTAMGMGDYIRTNINRNAAVKLERYRTLVETVGLSPEEATRKMADAAVPIEDAERIVNSGRMTGDIYDAARRVADKLETGLSPQITQFMRASVVSQLAAGVPQDEAIEAARRDFETNYTAIDGVPVRRDYVPAELAEEFNDAWPEYRDNVLMPALTKQYGEGIGQVYLRPHPRMPGQFLMFRRGADSTADLVTPITKDGKALLLDPSKVVVERTRFKQKKDAEKLDRDAEAGASVLPAIL